MRVTLKDVAERADVSIKTVSNVVHGYRHVTAETRDRVQKALEDLGYRPNLSARGLRTGRTNLIALALPRLRESYFGELADCVVRAADKHDFTVLIDNTEGRRDQELQVVSGFRQHFIDGLLFSPLTLEWDDIRDVVGGLPMVLLGELLSADEMADHVAIDNVAAAQLATQHLLELGRRRIAVLGTRRPKKAGTASLRLEGYKRALREARISLDMELLISVNGFHYSEGATAMSELLDLRSPPDAVFCLNDALALGALRTLNERRVAVPDEIAVVGFDDIEEGQFSQPTLTTISPDKMELATLAVDALVNRMAAGPHEHRELRASFSLIERESTLGVQHRD